MKRISSFLLIICLVLLQVVPVFAESPYYPVPDGRTLVKVTVTTYEAYYVRLKWYQVGKNGNPDKLLTTTKHAVPLNSDGLPRRKYTGTYAATLDGIKEGTDYYCDVQQSISLAGGYTNLSNHVHVDVIYNPEDVTAYIGQSVTLTAKTSDSPLNEKLVASRQWYMHTDADSEFHPIAGEDKWTYVRPVHSSNAEVFDKEWYFLRTELVPSAQINYEFVDTYPTVVTWIRPKSVEYVSYDPATPLPKGPGPVNGKMLVTYADGKVVEFDKPDRSRIQLSLPITTTENTQYPFTFDVIPGVSVSGVIIIGDHSSGVVDPVLLDKTLSNMRVSYVGAGDVVGQKWNPENFIVEVQFAETGNDWYRYNKFTLNPTTVQKIGENQVTATVTYNQKSLDAKCIATGVEQSVAPDNPTTGLYAEYADAYITKGTDYIDDKLTITAKYTTADGTQSIKVSPRDCNITTEIQGGTVYIILINYDGMSTAVNVPYVEATPTRMEATYKGECVEHTEISRSNATVTIRYSDGTITETDAWTVDPYDLVQGMNSLTVHSGDLSCTMLVPALPVSSVTVNMPQINVQKVETEEEPIAELYVSWLDTLFPAKSVYAATAEEQFEVSIIDQLTTTQQPTTIMYRVDNGSYTVYQNKFRTKFTKGVHHIEAYATYGTLRSDVVAKDILITDGYEVEDVVPTGLKAYYTGPSVHKGGQILSNLLKVSYTYDEAGKTSECTDYVVADYEIKAGTNTLTVTDNTYGFKATFTVYCSDSSNSGSSGSNTGGSGSSTGGGGDNKVTPDTNTSTPDNPTSTSPSTPDNASEPTANVQPTRPSGNNAETSNPTNNTTPKSESANPTKQTDTTTPKKGSTSDDTAQPDTIDVPIPDNKQIVKLLVEPVEQSYKIGTTYSKDMVKVTAVYADGTRKPLTDYSLLPGTIVAGANTITVASGTISGTCEVLGSGEPAEGFVDTYSNPNPFFNDKGGMNLWMQNAYNRANGNYAAIVQPTDLLDKLDIWITNNFKFMIPMSNITGMRPWFLGAIFMLGALALALLGFGAAKYIFPMFGAGLLADEKRTVIKRLEVKDGNLEVEFVSAPKGTLQITCKLAYKDSSEPKIITAEVDVDKGKAYYFDTLEANGLLSVTIEVLDSKAMKVSKSINV